MESTTQGKTHRTCVLGITVHGCTLIPTRKQPKSRLHRLENPDLHIRLQGDILFSTPHHNLAGKTQNANQYYSFLIYVTKWFPFSLNHSVASFIPILPRKLSVGFIITTLNSLNPVTRTASPFSKIASTGIS